MTMRFGPPLMNEWHWMIFGARSAQDALPARLRHRRGACRVQHAPPTYFCFWRGGAGWKGCPSGSLAFLEEKLAPRHAVLLAASLRLSTAPSSLLSSHPTLHHARAAASCAAVGPIRQKEKLVAKQCSPDPFSLFELLWDVFLRSCYPLGRMNTHTC